MPARDGRALGGGGVKERRRLAGPVLRSGELALAAIDALREDNPDKELVVVDHGAYLRIEAEGGLVLKRATMEECLGRPFVLQEIEGALIGFSGQIEFQEDSMRWYFKSAPGGQDGQPLS
jgi:toluene monooxygenase system protein D